MGRKNIYTFDRVCPKCSSAFKQTFQLTISQAIQVKAASFRCRECTAKAMAEEAAKREALLEAKRNEEVSYQTSDGKEIKDLPTAEVVATDPKDAGLAEKAEKLINLGIREGDSIAPSAWSEPLKHEPRERDRGTSPKSAQAKKVWNRKSPS